MGDSGMAPVTDGAVSIRPFTAGDRDVLVAGWDVEARRWLGSDNDPMPAGCVVAHGQVVGWIDYDADRGWLRAGEVNVGYQVFPEHRGRGYATRSVRLLVQHLADTTSYRAATMLIDERNGASLAVAARLGAEPVSAAGTPPGQLLLVLPIRRSASDPAAP